MPSCKPARETEALRRYRDCMKWLSRELPGYGVAIQSHAEGVCGDECFFCKQAKEGSIK